MSFLSELHDLNTAFLQGSKSVEGSAALLINDLFKTGKEKLESAMRATAAMGKKTYRVSTWVGRGERYGEFYMVDLLHKGDFIKQSQAYLDATYGTAPHRLRIFNHKITGESYGLTISWDPTGFENIDVNILKTRPPPPTKIVPVPALKSEQRTPPTIPLPPAPFILPSEAPPVSKFTPENFQASSSKPRIKFVRNTAVTPNYKD